MNLLDVEDIYGGYGGVDILNGVSLRVEPGELVVIIGPNGAGKSTALKAIFGLVEVRSGRVDFDGRDITGLRPDQIVRRGLCYVPQEQNVFPSLSVHENLEMGAYILSGDIGPRLEKVYELFPPLVKRRNQPGRVLSGGERQMLAMGRALMLDPRLLLLDEPTAGLSPRYVGEMFDKVREISRSGVSILMIEQNAKQSLAFADRGYVLTMGRNRYEDAAANLLANREVATMFLGG